MHTLAESSSSPESSWADAPFSFLVMSWKESGEGWLYRNSLQHYAYHSPHLMDVGVGLALVWVLELGVADKDGVHVGAGVLVQLVVAGDHDHGDLYVTENAELVGLLQ